MSLRRLQVLAASARALAATSRFRKMRRRARAAEVAGGVVVLSLAALVAPVTSTAATVEGPTAQALSVVDHARRVGLQARRTITWSAVSVDYNRDGREDVLINYHGRGAKLWRNRGGRYVRVARAAWPTENARGLHIDRHNCAWADVDRNGRPDVYCSTGRTALNHVKFGRDNELWLQSRRGRFREVGTRWGVGDVCGRGRVVTFINANGDRFPDLFLGNQPGRRGPDRCNTSRRLPNEESKLFLNVNGQRFRYAPRFGDFGAGPGRRCAEVVDFNGDGWQDLFACRGGDATPRLYVNRQGRGLTDVTAQHALGVRITDATTFDLDGDLDQDIVTAATDGFAYHLNDNGVFGSRTLFAPTANVGRSVAVGDADGDGDGDIYGMLARGRRANPDDRIWLNTGLDFSASLRTPRAGGVADEVIDLNPNPAGRTAFLVLNGAHRSNPGPVQLIRLLGQP
jgi:hypothetical protein